MISLLWGEKGDYLGKGEGNDQPLMGRRGDLSGNEQPVMGVKREIDWGREHGMISLCLFVGKRRSAFPVSRWECGAAPPNLPSAPSLPIAEPSTVFWSPRAQGEQCPLSILRPQDAEPCLRRSGSAPLSHSPHMADAAALSLSRLKKPSPAKPCSQSFSSSSSSSL